MAVRRGRRGRSYVNREEKEHTTRTRREEMARNNSLSDVEALDLILVFRA
jgi:hypothetical protein